MLIRWRYCYARLGDIEAAHDCVQEICLEVQLTTVERSGLRLDAEVAFAPRAEAQSALKEGAVGA